MVIPSKNTALANTMQKFETGQPRALITGLRGFTGEYLARELAACGYEVYGTAFGNEKLGAGMYYVDLCDRDALEKVINEVQPDIVAHLAAISFVGHGNVDDIYRINVMGTRNLLEALSKLPTCPSAVLLASSANIYGNTNTEIIGEDEKPQPANDYAVSKLAMEHVAKLWMDKLPIIIARPFNYTGLGQSENFLLPKIVGHFQRGEKRIELGNLDIARDFSDVRMVARAYCELLQSNLAGEVINICSGRAYTLNEIIAMVESIAGYQIKVEINPAFVRDNEVKRLLGNPAKLRRHVSGLPNYSMKETLSWMLGVDLYHDTIHTVQQSMSEAIV